MARRALLGGLLLLGGCGFHPLYGAGDDGGVFASYGGRVGEELAEVKVSPIAERTGQLLQRGLENRLNPNGPPAVGKYDLKVVAFPNIEIEGFRRDGTPTRVRYIYTANWSLFDSATPPNLIRRTSTRVFDAYNIPDQQYFAADLSRDAAERRIMAQLADQITEGVALQLRQRLQTQAASR